MLCLVKYLESTAQSNSGDAEKEALPGEGVGTQDGWGRGRDHKAGERGAGSRNADRLLGGQAREVWRRERACSSGAFSLKSPSFIDSFIHSANNC